MAAVPSLVSAVVRALDVQDVVRRRVDGGVRLLRPNEGARRNAAEGVVDTARASRDQRRAAAAFADADPGSGQAR